MSTSLKLTAVAITTALFASTVQAQIVLYSEPFNSGFTVGTSLVGSAGQGGGWFSSQRPQPPATNVAETSVAAQIQNIVGNPGNAVRFQTGGVSRQTTYWDDFAIDLDFAGQNNVRTSFDVFRTAPTFAPGPPMSTAYLAGLFNDSFVAHFLFGVDDLGQLAFVTNSGPTTTANTSIPLDQWSTITAIANFNTRLVTYEINGVPVDLAPVSMITGTGSIVADMDLQFIPASVAAISDIAYVDNLLVTIPEPATLGLIAGSAMLVLRRRSR